MSLREKLNKNPMFIVGVVALAVVVALWVLWKQITPSTTAIPNSRYFTTDDGKTWFAADMRKPSPFIKDGKEAVKARVYECKGKQFVGALEKMNDKASKLVTEYLAAKERNPNYVPPNRMELEDAMSYGNMRKKPGDDKWVPAPPGSDPSVSCSDGSNPTEVLP